jgi:RNA polymerase sigma factor (sigma-70 family)
VSDKFNDECLEHYYEALSKVKILTASEERELFLVYQSNGSRSAKRRIVRSCLKLVFSLAKGYWRDRDPETLKSLISAGNVGLLEAIDKFDLEKGSRFSSYASFWILMHVRNELTGLRDMVRPSAKERKRRMLSAKSRQKLAESGEAVEETAVYTSNFQALHSSPFLDSVPLDPDTQYSEIRKDVDSKYLFTEWFRFLRYREHYVVSKYYGVLANSDRLTLKDIAKNLNLSSERVRQIKEEALKKLRYWANFSGVSSLSDIS